MNSLHRGGSHAEEPGFIGPGKTLWSWFLSLVMLSIAVTSLPAQTPTAHPSAVTQKPLDFSAISSPIIFRGDAITAYRDPAAVYHDGWFYIYYTYIMVEPDKQEFMYTAWSKSTDLCHWTKPKIFTPRDQKLNYSSPGDVIRFGDDWVMCLQTYPKPSHVPPAGEAGNSSCRLWTMRSRDLENWGPAELMAVKGPKVSPEKMGRMIDPDLFEDNADAEKWWCLFKQQGKIWLSWSRDLKTWTFTGNSIVRGENPSVIREGNDYLLCYSPPNGVGIKRSSDLKTWTDEGTYVLAQKDWPWTKGRLTAGFILDLRNDPQVGKALLFFCGQDFHKLAQTGGLDNFASMGLAWSTDLKNWQWPGKVP